MSEQTLLGGCLCGEVRYSVSGRAKSVEHCHCSMCRRAHGALYASGALIDKGQLTLTKGESKLSEYQSSPGNWRRFCARCGSQLFVTIDHIPGEVYFWAATLDDGAHPGQSAGSECHIHVASKASWELLPDGLPCHDEMAPSIGPGAG